MITRFAALTRKRRDGFIPWFTGNRFAPLIWAQSRNAPDLIAGFELEDTVLLSRLIPLFPEELPGYFRLELADAADRVVYATGGAFAANEEKRPEPVLVMPFSELLLPNMQLRAFLLPELLPTNSFRFGMGLALAALGCHTLCLDCDITLRNLDLALGLSDRALMDFTDVIAGRCTLEDAVVQHPKYPKLHLLTAPLSARPMPIAPEQMKALLDRIRQTYDYCLIDAPAGLGMGFHLASDYADRAVVVTNTDASSLRDAQRTVMELDRLGRGNLHLVVGRVEKKLLRSLHTTIDDAMDAAGLPLLGVVPEDRNVPYALNTGIPLRECSNYAARAYENIARRIMGQRIPLMRI